MNRSYSKIRHIKNSNILLENRLLKEDETLDNILKKLNDNGFDSLNAYERTVLRDYKNYAEKNKNLDRFNSPDEKSRFLNWDDFGMEPDPDSPEGFKLTSFDPEFEIENNNDLDIGPVGDEHIIANFNKNNNFWSGGGMGKFDLSEYEKVDCFKTIEEFSKIFPIFCYKAFGFFDPKLSTNSEINKSSDFPEWWWKLQQTDNKTKNIAFFRIYDSVEEENKKGKKLFETYRDNLPGTYGCLQVYKKIK